MSEITKIVSCPCCSGTGNDYFYNLDRCTACEGTGEIKTIVYGDPTKFIYGDGVLHIDEFNEDPQLAADVWEWVEDQFKGKNWWHVHASVPILSTIEDILLSEGILSLSDIPGGPNNAKSPSMTKVAKELEKALLKLAEEAKKNPEVVKQMSDNYNSYRDRFKPKTQDLKDISKQIQEAAAKAAELTEELRNAAQTAPSPTPPISKDTNTMEKSSVTDRLKTGGRSIVEAGKKGVTLGTVTAANKGAVDFLEYKLGDKYPDILKTEAGRKAIQLLIPALMILICEMDEGDKIPAKKHVRLAAELAVEGTSADAMEQLMTFLLSNGGVLLQAYASAGQDVEASQIAEVFDASAEMERVTQKERVPDFVNAKS